MRNLKKISCLLLTLIPLSSFGFLDSINSALREVNNVLSGGQSQSCSHSNTATANSQNKVVNARNLSSEIRSFKETKITVKNNGKMGMPITIFYVGDPNDPIFDGEIASGEEKSFTISTPISLTCAMGDFSVDVAGQKKFNLSLVDRILTVYPLSKYPPNSTGITTYRFTSSDAAWFALYTESGKIYYAGSVEKGYPVEVKTSEELRFKIFSKGIKMTSSLTVKKNGKIYKYNDNVLAEAVYYRLKP